MSRVFSLAVYAQCYKIGFDMAAFGANSLKPTVLWSNHASWLQRFMVDLNDEDRRRVAEHRGETTKRKRVVDPCMQQHKSDCARLVRNFLCQG